MQTSSRQIFNKQVCLHIFQRAGTFDVADNNFANQLLERRYFIELKRHIEKAVSKMEVVKRSNTLTE